MGLKELAAEAWQKYQAAKAQEEAKEQAQVGEEARQFCVEALGVEPDDVDGDCVMVEGIALVYYHDWRSTHKWFALAGTCPDCKQGCEATRVDIHDLVSLGDALSQEFRPGCTHHCPAKVAVESWEDRFKALLHEAAEEVA